MSAQIVLNYYLEQYQTLGNTLTDLSFDEISFLVAKEKVTDMKGQWVSKSYYAENNKEAIRITYEKIVGIHIYNGVEYPDTFLGIGKSFLYLDWAGEVANTKKKQPEYFNLEPVFIGDGTETVVGFSSPKQRQVLKGERQNADDYLQAKNPQLYAVLYAMYKTEYLAYMTTGVKTSFVDAMNAETNESVLAMLNTEVFGYEPMTVKELIIMNLQ
jgi:alpha-ketoglutarate-dependent taurine dioxygenase